MRVEKRCFNFTWKNWAVQKAVSLVVSACTMGFSALRPAGKATQALAQGAMRAGMQQGAKRIVAKVITKLVVKQVAMHATGVSVVFETSTTPQNALKSAKKKP